MDKAHTLRANCFFYATPLLCSSKSLQLHQSHINTSTNNESISGLQQERGLAAISVPTAEEIE